MQNILLLWKYGKKMAVEKLKKARDGLAHKNAEIVSNKFNNGKPISITEIDLVMSGQEVLPYIMMTIRRLFKLVDRWFSDRYIATKQILDG
jgi:hypothetical protein